VLKTDNSKPDDPVEVATGIPALWFDRFQRELSPSQDAGRVQVLLAVKAVAHRAEAAQAEWLVPHGLNLALFNVLILLWGAEGRARPLSHISRALVCSSAHATKVVNQLVRAGLVSREGDPGDRRTVLARLTPEGERGPGHRPTPRRPRGSRPRRVFEVEMRGPDQAPGGVPGRVRAVSECRCFWPGRGGIIGAI